jgi:hypothetical protein
VLLGFALALPLSVEAQPRNDFVRVAVGTGTLAGTLTLPAGAGPHPAAAL